MLLRTHINRFLNKKTDFTEDASLKSLNETHHFLAKATKTMERDAIRKNIRYFFEHEKKFLAKLLANYVIKLIILISIVYGIIFGLQYYFDMPWEPKLPVNKITVYMNNDDSLNITKMDTNVFIIKIIFPYDIKKDWKKYTQGIHNIETHGTTDSASYFQRNGEYWGRYQLGLEARNLAGIKRDMTFEEFASNPLLQEACFYGWMKHLKGIMQPEINRYSGRFMNGIQITESGILSMAHNAGTGACKAYLSRGANPPGGLTFLKMGGYYLNLE